MCNAETSQRVERDDGRQMPAGMDIAIASSARPDGMRLYGIGDRCNGGADAGIEISRPTCISSRLTETAARKHCGRKLFRGPKCHMIGRPWSRPSVVAPVADGDSTLLHEVALQHALRKSGLNNVAVHVQKGWARPL